MRIIVVIFIFLIASTANASSEADFKNWLEGVKSEVAAKGILTEDVEQAIDTISLDTEVIELDKKQPEKTSSFERYKKNVLRENFVDEARSQYQANRELLAKVESAYGVPAEYIVALWGMESRFGDNPGYFSVLDSLASLAYEGRRAEFFRKELITALKIIASGNAGGEFLSGSWAGAMGQCQFMPSSYMKFAVDFDGDGKRDIWNSEADIFASIANYLKTTGWDDHQWGYRARVPEHFNAKNSGRDLKLTLDDWAAMGVKKAGGGSLTGDTKAALVLIDNSTDNAFLVFGNFDVIMDWNRSVYFATTVGMLADEIKTKAVQVGQE